MNTTAIRPDIAILPELTREDGSRPGDAVYFTFTVINQGRDIARNVTFEASATNLIVEGVRSGCEGSPCFIQPGATISLRVDARRQTYGRFRGQVQVAAAQDADPGNNSASFDGVTPRAAWPRLAGIVGVLLFAAGLAALEPYRRYRWRKLVKVSHWLDPEFVDASGTARMPVPAMRVSAWIEAADARPEGPIRFGTRQE